MQKISPCLWFDDQGEAAARFYTSIFKNSRIREITHYDENVAKAAARPAGSVMTVTFEIEGQEFMALNGGPQFKLSEAISLMVYCDTQEELDQLWDRLSEGGEIQACGWLKDKFGLSWQIVPREMDKWLNSPDAAARGRMMMALLQMKKLDSAELKRAFAGE